MADNLSTNVEIKYLDYKGLELLWSKIKRVFPQTANLGELLDGLEDPFTRKSYVDKADQALWTKIGQVEEMLGGNLDEDTIIIGKDDNKMKTNLILDIDHDSKTIRLVTKANPEDPEDKTVKTIVSSIDYTPFIKDSFLDNVSLVVIPDDDPEGASGQAPGTYFRFVFNTTADGTQKETIYLSTEDLGVETYVGGSYITISTNDKGQNEISLDTVQLDTYLEDYISSKSASITQIREDVRSLQTSIGGIEDKIQKLDDVVINGYTNDDSTFVPGLQIQVTQVDQKVSTYEDRIVWLETNAANTVITPSEIDALIADVSI